MGWGAGFFYRFKGGGEHCTRASLHSDTVEDLIRISVEGSSLEDVDARESVASWFSQGQRSRRPNYRSWPSEGHVTAMSNEPRDVQFDALKTLKLDFIFIK